MPRERGAPSIRRIWRCLLGRPVKPGDDDREAALQFDREQLWRSGL